MRDGYLPTLRNEFEAGDASFLIQLRCDLHWSKAAFTRLVTAMEQCCADLENADHVDRWAADGFWYMSWFVQSWSSDENFPREFPDQYYRDAYELLFDLASYFFTGAHPYENRSFRCPE
jgi:hypothetical protein